MMGIYEGKRTNGGLAVAVDGTHLDPRFDLCNHSPDGFECGYEGSGPAQLAVAILAHYLGDDFEAKKHYMRFKSLVISKLPRDRDWQLSTADVARALDQIVAR